MQGKPSHTTHKLLCRQSWGEEDVTFCGVDTKNWTLRWGDIWGYFCCWSWEVRTAGQAPRGQKRRQQAPGCHGLTALGWEGEESGNMAPQWSLLAQRKNTVPHTPASKGSAKPSPYCGVWRAAAVATSISSFPKTKARLAHHCCCQFSTVYECKVHIHLM